MAEEKSNVKEVKVEDEKLKKLRDGNSQLSQITLNIGQAHIRKKEIDENIESLEEQFKTINQELQEALAELEKEYPKGNLNLQSGILNIPED